MNIDFKPMPKRFMVWDKPNEQFLTIGDAYPKCQLSDNEKNSIIFSLQDLIALFSEVLYYDYADDYVVCQSTNLFDKDGKEIFEGSILDNGHCRALCRWDNSNAEFDFIMIKGHDSVKGWLDEYKMIGHILSNGELLEEK